MSPAEIDRLMAEGEDMIAFGVTIGIDPDDDTAETYARLMAAWEQHCSKAARNEREGDVADESEQAVDDFSETGHAVESN